MRLPASLWSGTRTCSATRWRRTGRVSHQRTCGPSSARVRRRSRGHRLCWARTSIGGKHNGRHPPVAVPVATQRAPTPMSCSPFQPLVLGPTGKLPLLQLEAEGAEALKAKGLDCLNIFLMPPSQEAHEERVRRWLTETDEEVAARQVGPLRGRGQQAAAIANMALHQHRRDVPS